jgi:hypothetical protein
LKLPLKEQIVMWDYIFVVTRNLKWSTLIKHITFFKFYVSLGFKTQIMFQCYLVLMFNFIDLMILMMVALTPTFHTNKLLVMLCLLYWVLV